MRIVTEKKNGFLLFEVLLSVIILSIGVLGAVQAFSHVMTIASRSASFFYGMRVAEDAYVSSMILDDFSPDAVTAPAGKNREYTVSHRRTNIEWVPESLYDDSVQTPESVATYITNDVTILKSKKPLWDILFISRAQDIV